MKSFTILFLSLTLLAFFTNAEIISDKDYSQYINTGGQPGDAPTPKMPRIPGMGSTPGVITCDSSVFEKLSNSNQFDFLIVIRSMSNPMQEFELSDLDAQNDPDFLVVEFSLVDPELKDFLKNEFGIEYKPGSANRDIEKMRESMKEMHVFFLRKGDSLSSKVKLENKKPGFDDLNEFVNNLRSEEFSLLKELAKKFMRTTVKKEREEIHSDAQTLVKDNDLGSQGNLYLAVMKKVLETNDDAVYKEQERLLKLTSNKKSVSSQKLEKFEKRLKILNDFIDID